jgi:hypothetical protein
MQRTSFRVLTAAATVIAFGACKNGSNNASDTLGVGAGSAAGQVPPGAAQSPTMADTSAARRVADSTRSAQAAGAGAAARTPSTAGTDTTRRAKRPPKR